MGAHLDGEVPLREVDLLLLRLLGDTAGLVLGKGSSESASLLGAEVERKVLLALVEDAELVALVEVDDGEDTGDRLADVVAAFEKKPSELWAFCVYYRLRRLVFFSHLGELGRSTTSNLLGAELDQLGLQLIKLLLEILLVLSPKLGSLDLAGRLQTESAFRSEGSSESWTGRRLEGRTILLQVG